MTKKKNSGKILIWIACILSFLATGIGVLGIFALSFNLYGLTDMMQEISSKLSDSPEAIDISYVCLELGIVAVIDLSAGLRYLKIARNPFIAMRQGNALIFQCVLQMLFASLIAGIFAIIGISIISKQKFVRPTQEEQMQYINETKKKAMGEAIARLRELKEQGAISEEEFYETLNKILEN
jgi:uncharacterized membrane protein